MNKITVKQKIEVEVTLLEAYCDVRYWEDAEVNGVPDETGTLIPCRMSGRNTWNPLIELATGKILNWTPGKTAKINYKVCDAGSYYLYGKNKTDIVKSINGYVPAIMCPGGDGYGDYVIMNVDENGIIEDWVVCLGAFEMDDED